MSPRVLFDEIGPRSIASVFNRFSWWLLLVVGLERAHVVDRASFAFSTSIA